MKFIKILGTVFLQGEIWRVEPSEPKFKKFKANHEAYTKEVEQLTDIQLEYSTLKEPVLPKECYEFRDTTVQFDPEFIMQINQSEETGITCVNLYDEASDVIKIKGSIEEFFTALTEFQNLDNDSQSTDSGELKSEVTTWTSTCTGVQGPIRETNKE